MEFTYTIRADNFLEYYLFMVSESKTITRKRNIAKYSFSVIYLLFGIYFFSFSKYLLGIAFIAISIAWYYFYPLLNKRSLKRFYVNHLAQNYKQKMDSQTILNVGTTSIIIVDANSENQIDISELDKIIETALSFFIKLKSGTSFIVPKDQIDILLFREQINALQIAIQDSTNWQ